MPSRVPASVGLRPRSFHRNISVGATGGHGLGRTLLSQCTNMHNEFTAGQGVVYFFSCYTYAIKFRFEGSRVVGWFLWVGE
eukprot:4881767-Prymnesium_polylepis.1